MSTKRFYPIYLDVADASCIVVGGGRVAARKIQSLADCGAAVTVVSPEITEEIRQWVESEKVAWVCDRYRSDYLAGARLVIASTSERSVNAQVYADARAAGIPVNTVDDPEYCTFIVPALLRRGDILVSVGTGGGAPGVSGRIRDAIGELIGEEWEALVAVLKENRERIKSLPDASKSDFWGWVKSIPVEQYREYPGELRRLVLAAVERHLRSDSSEQ